MDHRTTTHEQRDLWLEPFFRRMEQRDHLGEPEKQAIRNAMGERQIVKAGADIVLEGSRPKNSILLIDGLATRYTLLEGGQRQITALHVAGDFVDLHSFLLKQMDHSVGALSDCTIITYPHENLKVLTQDFPHLTRVLWLMTLLDSAMLREWLVGMGRLTALARTAHLICELRVRLGIVALVENERFQLPITQAELADALGISTVHVNRVLQDLRARHLLSWQGTTVEILDWEGLSRLAEFDPLYLHLVPEPR